MYELVQRAVVRKQRSYAQVSQTYRRSMTVLAFDRGSIPVPMVKSDDLRASQTAMKKGTNGRTWLLFSKQFQCSENWDKQFSLIFVILSSTSELILKDRVDIQIRCTSRHSPSERKRYVS